MFHADLESIKTTSHHKDSVVFSLYFHISSTFTERFNLHPEHCPLEESDGAAIENLLNCLSFSSKRRVLYSIVVTKM